MDENHPREFIDEPYMKIQVVHSEVLKIMREE
jgi:hypothetical protein